MILTPEGHKSVARFMQSLVKEEGVDPYVAFGRWCIVSDLILFDDDTNAIYAAYDEIEERRHDS